jgi:hypothetical protein
VAGDVVIRDPAYVLRSQAVTDRPRRDDVRLTLTISIEAGPPASNFEKSTPRPRASSCWPPTGTSRDATAEARWRREEGLLPRGADLRRGRVRVGDRAQSLQDPRALRAATGRPQAHRLNDLRVLRGEDASDPIPSRVPEEVDLPQLELSDQRLRVVRLGLKRCVP